MSDAKTTTPGYVNRNRQAVVRDTGLPGNDHLQRIHVLRCHLAGFSVLILFARLALTLLVSTSLQAQSHSPLDVKRPDGATVSLSSTQLAALPRVSGRATAHGTTFTFEGVDLRDVLRQAGVIPVDSLRSAHLRRVVIFVAADGYSALIALSDLDASIGGRRAVLVDREDGRPLGADYGPRRVIIEGDQRPTRCVRQVLRLEVVDVR